jgi:serine/threonine protein kinase
VYYGVWRKKEVAVKTLKNNTMNKKTFLEEALIMQKIRHKNLVTERILKF